MSIRSLSLASLCLLLSLPARGDQPEVPPPRLLALAAASGPATAEFSPGLREAAGKLEQREPIGCLSALAKLPEAERRSAAGRLLEAEALHRLGRYSEAIPAYETSLRQGSLLRDRLRLHLGESLLEVGRPAEAAAVLGDLEAASPHRPRSLVLRARALRASGEATRAVLELEAALRTATDPLPDRELDLLRLELAASHLSVGEADAGRAVLGECVLFCTSSFRRQALEALVGLGGEAGTQEDDGSWTALLAADRKGSTGLRSLSRRGALRPARLAAYLRATSAEAAGETAASVALHGGVLETPDQPRTDESLRAAALAGLARGLTTMGRLSGARARWLQLAAEHPAHPLAPQARLAASELASRMGDHEEVARSLQAYLLLYPTDPGRPRAFFQWGWALLRLGRHAEAAELFGSAASFPARAADEAATLGGSRIVAAARARYWHARSLSLAGEADAASVAYRELLTRHPLSYYAALARSQLPEPGLTPHPDPVESVDGGDLDPRVRRARQAAALGLRREARRQLRELLQTPSRARHPRDLLVAARTLEALGQRDAARALYRAAILHDGGGLLPSERQNAMHLAFPRPHQELIEREAARWKLSPFLVYGLILRESGFRACARSRVGAKGLMQLMGPAASDAATDLGLPVPSPDDLCDPALNVRLGTWHLTKLLRHYKGSKILAVAAYNAGAGSVDRWRERNPELPLDILVEEIPFDETRVYVRAVLSAARGYAWTWDRPATSGVGTRLSGGPQQR